MPKLKKGFFFLKQSYCEIPRIFAIQEHTVFNSYLYSTCICPEPLARNEWLNMFRVSKKMLQVLLAPAGYGIGEFFTLFVTVNSLIKLNTLSSQCLAQYQKYCLC